MNTLESIHSNDRRLKRTLPDKNTLVHMSSVSVFNKQQLLLVVSILFLMVDSCNLFAATGVDSTKHWVGTWACSPYPMGDNNTNMPPPIANNTVRQIIRVSIGGDTVRVRFSNKTSQSSVTMNAVNIAVSPDGTKSPVTASSITPLKFSSNTSVTMKAGEIVTSDPVAFTLTPSMRVAITINYGTASVGNDLTGHVASRTDSYVATGDQSANATFTGTVQTTMHWLHIIGMDVLADTMTHAAVCFGNSITDGYGLGSTYPGGLQNRWTDAFSVKLLANPATAKVGVLNQGIGGTNVVSGLNCGKNRFQNDILDQVGVRWLILFYGINDIGAGTNATTITGAYQTMISEAHAKGIKVYGATITPCGTYKDANYTSKDAVRNDVNKWIRTTGNFDGVIDFDKAIQDPAKPANLLAKYSNDGLHPNADGYKFLGESVDLKLFSTDTTAIHSIDGNKKLNIESGKLNFNFADGTPLLTFEIPHDAFVSLKVYSLLGKEIAELAGKDFSSGKHTVEVKNRDLTNGTYIYSMKINSSSISKRLVKR